MTVSPKGPITHQSAEGFVPVVPPAVTPTPKRNPPKVAAKDPSPAVTPQSAAIDVATQQQINADILQTSLEQLLNDESYYSPNPLNILRQPAYKIRLYMTTEHDIVNSTTALKIDELLDVLDSLPQVTIAESGVTAGFNLKEVEFEHITGPGWRNKNCALTKLSITITEPLGNSLLESILDAGNSLGIQNFAKMWYYLEVSFIAYNADGSINTSPLADNPDFNLINRGRWVYQISIGKMDMKMDESGATYTLSDCFLYPLAAFDDKTCGVTPDILAVSGKTIKEFCDNFAMALTDAWTKRYLGEIFKFNFVIHDVAGLKTNPGNFSLVSGAPDHDPQILSLDSNDNTIPTAHLAKETSINDVITFLYINCEEAQKLMLGTKTGQLEDDTNKDSNTTQFNGKTYRVPIVPHIEPAVVVTGYDPITGQYMQNITYHIWAYKTYGVNIAPSQWDNSKKNVEVSKDIVKELQQNGFLRKQYQHRFTGLNTEVIRCDLGYDFAFSALLPQLSGWRNSSDSVAVHAKYNQDASQNGGAQSDKNRNQSEITQGKPTDMSSATNKVSDSQIGGDLNSINDNINQITNEINSPTRSTNSETGQPFTTDELKKQLKVYTDIKNSFQKSITDRRKASQIAANAKRDQLEKMGKTNSYAEDAISDAYAVDMTYLQSHGNESEISSGIGFTGQWHRGKSLVGAIFSQINSPAVQQSLLTIELEIRGDPYWLGHSQLDRTAVMTGGHLPTPDNASSAPNFEEGDATFALIFRFPSGIDDKGSPIIRSDDMFTGIYRVTTVKSTFSNGDFRQILTANRNDLVNLLKAQPSIGSGNSLAGTTTTASSSTLGNS